LSNITFPFSVPFTCVSMPALNLYW
jgi:hypothetical protein